jgi:hypothetical protein
MRKFRWLCWQAAHGGHKGYEEAGYFLARNMRDALLNVDIRSCDKKFDRFLELLARRDNAAILTLLERELPEHMSLVPQNQRRIFVEGMFRRGIEIETAPPDTVAYFNRRALLERGWNSALITTFLGEHDRRALDGPPMKLYLRSRVEAIENTREFRRAKQTGLPSVRESR